VEEISMMRRGIKEGLKMGFIYLVSISFLSGLSIAQPKNWPKNVTIASASIGGAVYLYSGGFAKLIYEKMGIPASVEVTGGSVHNVKLVNSNQVTFGASVSPSVYDGWHGTGWAKGTKHQDIRAVFHMNNVFFQIYALKKSGIKNIYDLTGKNMGVGPIGGLPHIFYPEILNELGIKPARFVNASASDLDSQLRDGLIDANSLITGQPWIAVKETEVVFDVNVFGVNKSDSKKLKKFLGKYPFIVDGIIPKGTYKANRDHDIETLTYGSYYFAHKDLPEDFVYEVVKKTFENIDIIIAAHPSAREARPEAIVNCAIPIHPGAVKYYREKGIKLPEALIPPN